MYTGEMFKNAMSMNPGEEKIFEIEKNEQLDMYFAIGMQARLELERPGFTYEVTRSDKSIKVICQKKA